jgi:hypothetical protein
MFYNGKLLGQSLLKMYTHTHTLFQSYVLTAQYDDKYKA